MQCPTNLPSARAPLSNGSFVQAIRDLYDSREWEDVGMVAWLVMSKDVTLRFSIEVNSHNVYVGFSKSLNMKGTP
jgi:hypothetical protein